MAKLKQEYTGNGDKVFGTSSPRNNFVIIRDKDDGMFYVVRGKDNIVVAKGMKFNPMIIRMHEHNVTYLKRRMTELEIIQGLAGKDLADAKQNYDSSVI